MKALFIKDLIYIKKEMLPLLLVLIVLPFIKSEFIVFTLVGGAVWSYGLISADLQSKWNVMEYMFPITPKEIVIEKYIIGYIAIFLTSLFALLTQSLWSYTDLLVTNVQLLVTAISASLFLVAMILPVVFKCSTVTSGLIVCVLFGSVIGLITGISDHLSTPMLAITNNLPMVIGIIILLNVISILISILIVTNRKK